MARSLQTIFEDARTDSDPDKGQNPGDVGPTVGNAREQNDLAKFSPAKQQEFIKNNPIIGQGSGAPSPLQPTATSPLQPTATSPIAAAATPAAPFVAPKKPLSVKTVLETPESAATAKPAADETDKIDWKSYLKESRTKADQTVEDAQKNIARILQEQKEFNAASAKDQSDVEKLYKDFKPIEYKSPKPTSLVEQWGSVAMVFAMLGSLFVRNHATTALNAAAAAMNGFKQGDEAAAKQAYENWKAANENAIKAQEFQTKRYDELLKGLKERQLAQKTITSEELAAYRAEIAAAATSFKDDVMLAAASDKSDLNGMKMTMDLLRQQLTTEQVKKVSGQVEKQREEEAGNAEFKRMVDAGELEDMPFDTLVLKLNTLNSPNAVKYINSELGKQISITQEVKRIENSKEYEKATPAQRAAMLALADPKARVDYEKKIIKDADVDVLNNSEDTQLRENILVDMAHYQAPPPRQPILRGNSKEDQVKQDAYYKKLQAIKKYNPDYNPALYGQQNTILAHWNDANAKPGASMITFNTFADHLEAAKITAEAYKKAAVDNDIPAAEKAVNAVRRALGMPDQNYTDLQTIAGFLTNEAVKASSGTAETESERSALTSKFTIGGANNIDTVISNLSVVEDLVGDRFRESQLSFVNGTGQPKEAFNKKLGEAALRLFGKRMGVDEKNIPKNPLSNQTDEGFINVTPVAPAAAPTAAAPAPAPAAAPAPAPAATPAATPATSVEKPANIPATATETGTDNTGKFFYDRNTETAYDKNGKAFTWDKEGNRVNK